MALVDRKYAGCEAWLEQDLVKQCGTWQQLSLMKKKAMEESERPLSCEGLTRSERLLWYRDNQDQVELDNYRASCSSNYRQLQLLRGVRGVEETEEDRKERDMTRSEAMLWYQTGGKNHVEQEKAIANLSGNWQQFYLMTRGRREERDPDQVPTRSERLFWYRNGGYEAVDARNQLAKDSSNWMQYKLTRDKNVFADDLEMRTNTKWSNFKNKEELSDYITQKRNESMEEREAVRAMVRSKITKDTLTKTAYDISRQPWSLEEMQEESQKKMESSLTREERIEKLRSVTEEMLSHKSDYSQSARALAMQAYKEAEEVAKASSSKRRVTVVQKSG